jgi:hypothetical protein
VHNRLCPVLAAVTVLLGAAAPASAALIVVPTGPGLDAEALATLLLAPNAGITINSASYAGAATASGTFSGGQPILGLGSGVLLTTGAVAVAPGPNDDPLATVDNLTAGDPLLDVLAGTTTADAAALRIAFTPTGDTISLRFVFASEEYPIEAFSMDDVFGAYVNGVNVALVPGTTQPIKVLTIHESTNAQYFIDNSNGARNLQYDGLTTVLTLTAAVTPGQVNLLELLIGDAVDGIGDSGVFLQAGSLTSCQPGAPGCSDGSVPEPATLILLAGGIVGWCSRRHRRRTV